MESFYGAMALGFLLGLRHALDPDHLVAVSTLVSRGENRKASWLLGASWGLGHALTVFVVGCAIILFNIRVPKGTSTALEFLVGAMLAVLGVCNLSGFRFWALGLSEHTHEHGHAEDHRHHIPIPPMESAVSLSRHVHAHIHLSLIESGLGNAGKPGLPRLFVVGMVHGLAGSTAVALLILAAVPGPRAGAAYLAAFGFGSLTCMTAFSAALGPVIGWAARRAPAGRWAAGASGAVSLAFGLYIMYRHGRAW